MKTETLLLASSLYFEIRGNFTSRLIFDLSGYIHMQIHIHVHIHGGTVTGRTGLFRTSS